MELIIYFFTVVLPGSAMLYAAYRYDEKHVPVGENFMPTAAELKAMKESILG